MEERLQQVVAHAYAHSPAFKARMDDAGLSPNDIQDESDLAKLPVLSKDSVVAIQQADPPFGGMLGVPLSEVRRVFFSPGPIYEPDAGDITPAMEVGKLALEIAGFTADDIAINCLSYHLVPAGLAVDWALEYMGATVVPGGVGNTELQLKMMLDIGVTGYVGTPSFLMALIKKAEDQGLNFKETFKVTKALVTAEPMPASLKKTFEDDYGISIANAYGTAEFGFLALATSGLAMQLLPDPIIQLVDPDTGQLVGSGEVGEVVVTNFNHAYPLIRYGTGDMGVNVDPNPGKSAQAERAVILVGRRGEAVKVRGMFVHPNQLKFAVGQVAGMMNAAVKGVRGIVTRPESKDVLSVQIGLSGEPPSGLEDGLKQAIQQACRVKVDHVEFLDPAQFDYDAPGMEDQRSWD